MLCKRGVQARREFVASAVVGVGQHMSGQADAIGLAKCSVLARAALVSHVHDIPAPVVHDIPAPVCQPTARARAVVANSRGDRTSSLDARSTPHIVPSPIHVQRKQKDGGEGNRTPDINKLLLIQQHTT